MKLAEALKLVHAAGDVAGSPVRVLLATGFTPLHLKTFLHARLLQASPDRRFAIREGTFGDLYGTLEAMADAPPDYAVVVVEWPDLDPRLAMRSQGSWDPEGFADVLAGVRQRLQRLAAALERLGAPAVVFPPTLELPPVAIQSTWQLSPLEAGLEAAVAEFVAQVATTARVAGASWLAASSAQATRYDAKSDMAAGFPYSLAHADAVADVAARLLLPRPPKKGLITDLDETLWKGILGEDGVAGVSWELDRKSHMHAAYQRLLHALTKAGVLVAVASKNDPKLVAEIFARRELLVRGEQLFPIEAGWGRKSEAVSRILRAWNVGADAVVFVDDSPMELAEVAAAHPGIECLQFPAHDQEVYQLLRRLRDLFGKQQLAEEDRLRGASLRGGAQFDAERSAAAGGDATAFLEAADPVVQLSFTTRHDNPRALELINKTNQFNLNGRRLIEKDLAAYLSQAGAFLMVASYADKYGPLGQIAVVLGRCGGEGLEIESWVMSCRAFSRRIEHACLARLFARFDAVSARLRFAATERNGPLQSFLGEITGEPPSESLVVERARFEAQCPPVPHRIEEVA